MGGVKSSLANENCQSDLSNDLLWKYGGRTVDRLATYVHSYNLEAFERYSRRMSVIFGPTFCVFVGRAHNEPWGVK